MAYRIVIADDEALICMDLKEILRKLDIPSSAWRRTGWKRWNWFMRSGRI